MGGTSYILNVAHLLSITINLGSYGTAFMYYSFVGFTLKKKLYYQYPKEKLNQEGKASKKNSCVNLTI